MGVYIKGMKMPANCDDCLLGSDCPHDQSIDGYKMQGGRPRTCPLVPVPPHGRLIDASESIRVEFYDEEHEEWTRHDMTIDELLGQSWVDADAITIIPAEEGK